ncbi:MAG: nitroreductase family protein [Chloroflexota bacterium]|nr:nitroreductase family protein [Chloroflexota bacterium]
MSLLMIDHDKCKKDGMCVTVCPVRIIEIEEQGAFPSLIESGEDICIDCGHCVAICPHGALSLKTMKAEDCTLVDRHNLPSSDQTEHLIQSRRSIRFYKETPVPRDILTNLVKVAGHAPSGHNTQPVEWLVIEDSKEVRRLAGIVVDWMQYMIKERPSFAEPLHLDKIVELWNQGQDFVLWGAPHIVIAHGSEAWPLAETDSIIALTSLQLTAESYGLGTCWAGFFQIVARSYPPMKEALQLPLGSRSYGALMIGYPKYQFARIPLRHESKIIWR